METIGVLIFTISAIANIAMLWLKNRSLKRELGDYQRRASEAIMKLERKVSVLEIQMENRP